MTYDIQERSREGGQPIELFQFNLGGTLYTYTNQETAVTYDAVTYSAEAISRGPLRNDFEVKQNLLSINVPASNAFALLYTLVIPGELVTVTVLQVHRTDGADETVTIFKGYVSTVAHQKDRKMAVITCRPITAGQTQPTPRQTYRGGCTAMFGDARCGINLAALAETATVSSISGGVNLTTSGLTNVGGGDVYWKNGYIKFGNEYRRIRGQSANVLTINLPFAITPEGSSATFVPGCQKTTAYCEDVHGNIENYRGFPQVPKKNPFATGFD